MHLDNYEMKVLLQEAVSGLYLTEASQWTPDPSLGRDFGNVVVALEATRKHRQRALDVILKFQDQKYDIRLPAQVPSHRAPVNADAAK